MMRDAPANGVAPITRERLFGWHAAPFSAGYFALNKDQGGGFREDAAGSMQVISGPIGRECAHFEAPSTKRVSRSGKSNMVVQAQAFVRGSWRKCRR